MKIVYYWIGGEGGGGGGKKEKKIKLLIYARIVDVDKLKELNDWRRVRRGVGGGREVEKIKRGISCVNRGGVREKKTNCGKRMGEGRKRERELERGRRKGG